MHQLSYQYRALRLLIILHKSFQCSASTLTNTSGRHRKQNVLPKQTHLGRALMRPRWRRLAKATAPAALKKPSGSGVPRGVPLVSFLATSWGMPRSSISDSPRIVRRTKDRKLNFKQLLLRTRVQLRAALYRFWMFILSRPRKNEPRKRTKGCRLWKLLLPPF